MKRLILASIAVLALCSFAAAQNPNFNASRTFEFDPDKTGGAVAYWKNGIGETDASCKTNFGLQLEKNAALTDNVSAGAVLNGLSGVVVLAGDTLGYDFKTGSPCSVGPRFNVSWSDGTGNHFSFVGGCGNAVPGPGQSPGWQRVAFNLQNPGQSFPVIPPGATLNSVILIVDEPGKYTLDDIEFRGWFVDKPGNSGAAPSCP